MFHRLASCSEGSYQSADLAHTCVGSFIREYPLDAPFFDTQPAGKALNPG